MRAAYVEGQGYLQVTAIALGTKTMRAAYAAVQEPIQMAMESATILTIARTPVPATTMAQ
jgi:hypothetical protein